MGGVHSLRFADLFPDSVMGVVLLDTPPPGFEEERLTLLTEQEREVRRQMLAAGPVDAPDVVGREREGANQEQWSFSSFPTTTPLAVVVADRQNFGTLGSPEAHRALWLRASERWLSLSSDSRIVVAEGSGHMVHHERQEIVVDVVGRMAAGRR
jgi:pimeloyl-ACP methyl ester carboxylesterase